MPKPFFQSFIFEKPITQNSYSAVASEDFGFIEQKMSAEEIGLGLMQKNLEELKFSSQFDSERIFRMLSEGSVENAFNILAGRQKTLENLMVE